MGIWTQGVDTREKLPLARLEPGTQAMSGNIGVPLDHEISRYIVLDFLKDITNRHFYRFDTYCYVNHHTPYMILIHIHIHYKYKVLPPITYLYHSNPYIINNSIHHCIHLQVHYLRLKLIHNIKLRTK